MEAMVLVALEEMELAKMALELLVLGGMESKMVSLVVVF